MALIVPNKLMWQPFSLYHISLQSVALLFDNLRREFDVLPPAMHFDIIKQISELSLCNDLSFAQLYEALADIDTIFKLLKVFKKRIELHQIFQLAMNWSFRSHTERISTIIAKNFTNRFTYSNDGKSMDNKNVSMIIEQGLAIGSFFSEAGWYADSERIHSHCLELVVDEEAIKSRLDALNCCQRLLHSQNGHCLFKEAEVTYKLALNIIEKLKSTGHCPDISIIYSEISTFYILQSKYQEAYEMGVKSVGEMLNDNILVPSRVIDIMRQAGKACVLKREFKKAGLLIKQAVVLAMKLYGEGHPKFADTLIDFGFYLLNSDAIAHGIQVYQKALLLRTQIFKGINLHIAVAHEELSYASYVYNYSRGAFKSARNEADKAINLLHQILPDDHLLISSSKRVKALILEEMAIDCHNKDLESKLLEEAYELHMYALKLTSNAFGEMNVQTAKHFGNLGRLLQSKKEYQKAEEMHLRAISIKEQLLGKDDYEVALSVGHLASLYNYDMGYSDKAEALYLRSIRIGKNLFGEAYSGLEYDYRGLIKVYTTNCDLENRSKYFNILRNWKLLREEVQENISSPLSELTITNPVDVKITIQEFLAL